MQSGVFQGPVVELSDGFLQTVHDIQNVDTLFAPCVCGERQFTVLDHEAAAIDITLLHSSDIG